MDWNWNNKNCQEIYPDCACHHWYVFLELHCTSKLQKMLSKTQNEIHSMLAQWQWCECVLYWLYFSFHHTDIRIPDDTGRGSVRTTMMHYLHLLWKALFSGFKIWFYSTVLCVSCKFLTLITVMTQSRVQIKYEQTCFCIGPVYCKISVLSRKKVQERCPGWNVEIINLSQYIPTY